MAGKPNLFIIGAAKSGTTSLFSYLEAHPDIYGCSLKEPNFFIWPELRELDCHDSMINETIKTEEEYLALFKNAKNEKYCMDGSIFTMFFKDALRRMKKYSPACKAIVIIRNPVDRVFSHFKMQRYRAEETRRFEEFLKYPISREGIDLLKLGLYSQQINNAYEILDKENVLVILFDDFKNDAISCLERVCEFLHIDKKYIPEVNEIHNRSRGLAKNKLFWAVFRSLERIWYKLGNPENGLLRLLKNRIKMIAFQRNKPDRKTQEFLYEYYRNDIEKTEKLTGLDLSGWKKYP